jgi:hypothetical protein
VLLIPAAVVLVVLASVLARQHVVAGMSNAGAVALGLIVLVGVVGFGHEGFEYSADQELKSASDFRVNVSSDAESGFDDVTETRSAAEVIAYMPVAGPRALLGPTPLAVHSARQVPAVLDAVNCWWTLLMAVRGFRRARELGSRRRLLVLLIPAAVVLVVLAVTLGNYGILVRQRPQIIVFLLPLVAFELALRSAVPEVVPLPELASVASPTAAARAVHAHHHRRRGPRTVPLFARLHDDR